MPTFGVILVRIQSECGKIGTRITPNTDTFHAVSAFEFMLLSTLLSWPDSLKDFLGVLQIFEHALEFQQWLYFPYMNWVITLAPTLTHFFPMYLFSSPKNILKNLRFSDVFRGDKWVKTNTWIDLISIQTLLQWSCKRIRQ